MIWYEKREEGGERREERRGEERRGEEGRGEVPDCLAWINVTLCIAVTQSS